MAYAEGPFPWFIRRVGLEFEWNPPLNTPELALALQYHFPEIETHSERMKKALLVTFPSQQSTSPPVLQRAPPASPPPTDPAALLWGTPNISPDPPSIQRFPSTASAPASSSHQGPGSARKGRVLNLSQKQLEDRRKNRGYACEAHRAKKQRCNPKTCPHNGLFSAEQEKLRASRRAQMAQAGANPSPPSPELAAQSPPQYSQAMWNNFALNTQWQPTSMPPTSDTTTADQVTNSNITYAAHRPSLVTYYSTASDPSFNAMPNDLGRFSAEPVSMTQQQQPVVLSPTYPPMVKPASMLAASPPMLTGGFSHSPGPSTNSISSLSTNPPPAQYVEPVFTSSPLPMPAAEEFNGHDLCQPDPAQDTYVEASYEANIIIQPPSVVNSDFGQFIRVASPDSHHTGFSYPTAVDDLVGGVRGLDLDEESDKPDKHRRRMSTMSIKKWFQSKMQAPRLVKRKSFPL